MTASTLHLSSPAIRGRRPGLRADPLARALALAVALGLTGLWIALLAARPAGDVPAAGRVAIVADAGGRPGAALAAARHSDAALRAPRSSFEAATDVRYFAALGYGTVVVAGPASRAAARAVAPEYPHTRFVLQALR